MKIKIMQIIKNSYIIITIIYTLATLLFYVPYVYKNRFDVIERNWDGPAYLIIAKTLYNRDQLIKDNYIRKYVPLPEQFAEKMPLTPIFIRLFSFMTYEKSMLFVSWLFGLLTLFVFFKLLSLYDVGRPLLVTLIYIFFPPRWFVLQKVGGAETVFMFFALGSIFFYKKKNYLLSSIFVMLTTLSKINGLLLFSSFFLIFLFKKKIRSFMIYLLAPLALIILLYFYQINFGDYTVLFKSFGRCYESFSIFTRPYAVFDASSCNVGTFHLEQMFWFYGISFYTILFLINNKKEELLLLFIPPFVPMLFIQHIDFTRYALFLYFLFGIIYAKYLIKKEAILIALILLPAVYLYTRNFINVNIFIP